MEIAITKNNGDSLHGEGLLQSNDSIPAHQTEPAEARVQSWPWILQAGTMATRLERCPSVSAVRPNS